MNTGTRHLYFPLLLLDFGCILCVPLCCYCGKVLLSVPQQARGEKPGLEMSTLTPGGGVGSREGSEILLSPPHIRGHWRGCHHRIALPPLSGQGVAQPGNSGHWMLGRVNRRQDLYSSCCAISSTGAYRTSWAHISSSSAQQLILGTDLTEQMLSYNKVTFWQCLFQEFLKFIIS